MGTEENQDHKDTKHGEVGETDTNEQPRSSSSIDVTEKSSKLAELKAKTEKISAEARRREELRAKTQRVASEGISVTVASITSATKWNGSKERSDALDISKLRKPSRFIRIDNFVRPLNSK